MTRDPAHSLWRSQLEAATSAVANSPDAPAWLKQFLREALALSAEMTPDVDAHPQDHSFFYPH